MFFSQSPIPSESGEGIQAQIFKKAQPFCGFGGFVQFDENRKSNCKMISVKTHYIALSSTKPIKRGEKIICDKIFLSNPDPNPFTSKDQVLDLTGFFNLFFHEFDIGKMKTRLKLNPALKDEMIKAKSLRVGLVFSFIFFKNS